MKSDATGPARGTVTFLHPTYSETLPEQVSEAGPENGAERDRKSSQRERNLKNTVEREREGRKAGAER